MNTFLKILAILLIVAVAVGISCGGTMLVGITIEGIFTGFGGYSGLTSALLSMPVSGIIGLIVFYRVLKFTFYKNEVVTWKELLLSSRFINAMKIAGIMLVIFIIFGLLISQVESYDTQQTIFESFMMVSSLLFIVLLYYYFLKKR